MCMADDAFERRISFAFLQDIKEKFLAKYSKERANTALPYGMGEFAKVIEKQMVCIMELNREFICSYNFRF
jgi:vesicle-associated membrane protein 7